jgi:chromosome segregation protein
LHFTRLRLTGFKSFVDSTELSIEPGATGIVGPNGCGKSNLLEALRWVMGENSAKRMRGAEMDDVIFGGTSQRPARNVAEVSLAIDNSDRTAPAAFNESDDLEVVRRIERGEGSGYRINGRVSRMRDVQILFADNNAGATSPSMVSQGRVGALINARPSDRRQLLEEAAGIAGLQSRRHEAELRLKAAESNLTRVEDVLGEMGQQLQGLARQVRQVQRYRTLSENIRKAEAVLLHLRWQQATAAEEDARRRFAEADALVGEAMRQAAARAREQADAATGLPALREAEASAAAGLQRIRIAIDQLAEEERRAAREAAELDRRLAQLESDIQRERSLAADAVDALERLSEEREEIALAREGEEEERTERTMALEAAEEVLAGLDEDLTQRTELAAGTEARRSVLRRQAQEGAERAAAIARRMQANRAEAEKLEQDLASQGGLQAAEAAIHLAEAEQEAATHAAEEAHQRRLAAEGEAALARDAFHSADGERGRLAAEVSALTDLAHGAAAAPQGRPLLETLAVVPGFEAALGAALGEDLAFSEDSSQPAFWSPLPGLEPPALPQGVRPLAAEVTGPALLSRALSQIGWVEDSALAQALHASLKPGQSLVTRDGDLWRWDGLVRRAGAPGAAAARLRQRNRLAALADKLAAAEAHAARSRAVMEEARAMVTAAADAERGGRDRSRAAMLALTQARDSHARLAKQTAGAVSRLETLRNLLEQQAEEREAALAAAEHARELEMELPPEDGMKAEVAALREKVEAARRAVADRQGALVLVEQQAATRAARLSAITGEMEGWRARAGGADVRVAEIVARAEDVRAEKLILEQKPAEIALQRETLAEAMMEGEEKRKAAADALAAAETRLREADFALRQAEHTLSEARETRVRSEAVVEAALHERRAVAERIEERLQLPPERAIEAAGLEPGAPLPDIEETRRRLERQTAERENMGPVNLRAEQEAGELEERLQGMNRERDDLTGAIARLRQAIGTLNRQAREKLLASFDIVDGHFQRLFAELFGGGRAHLRMTETEDPLEAGLEIYASPPGKKLQLMSLLSGGEQALTAMALIFAVFLTNPSPICVLDEVDAPLDDANVARFCDLVARIGRETGTRFLIITHHRLTMARMDRLYGVTMMERGVSRLVSVDLGTAAAMVDE